MIEQTASTLRHKHLDAIDYANDGGLVVGASCLTNRLWTGALFYFNKHFDGTNTKPPTASLQFDSGVTDVKWIAGTKKLIAALDSGAVALCEVSSQLDAVNQISESVAHSDIVSSVSLNFDRTKLVSAGHDKTVRIWDLGEFVPLSSYLGHADMILNVDCHPTLSDIFVTCSQDGAMLLWDTRKPKPASHIVVDRQFLPSLPTCIAWQPGTEHVVSIGTESGHVLLHDSRRGVNTPPLSVHVHDRSIYRLVFAPHRHDLLASVSNDSTVAVNKFSNSAASRVFVDRSHNDFVQGAAWHPATHRLTTCSWDGRLISRDVVESGHNGDIPSRSDVGKLVNGHTEEYGSKMETSVNGSAWGVA